MSATAPSHRQQRITAEMPVADLNDLLELVPADALVAPRFRVDIAAAIFSVTVTVGLLLWVAAS